MYIRKGIIVRVDVEMLKSRHLNVSVAIGSVGLVVVYLIVVYLIDTGTVKSGGSIDVE